MQCIILIFISVLYLVSGILSAVNDYIRQKIIVHYPCSMDLLNIKILGLSLLIGILLSPLLYIIQDYPDSYFVENISTYPSNFVHFFQCLLQFPCKDEKSSCTWGLISLLIFLLTNFIFYQCAMKIVDLKPNLMSVCHNICIASSFLFLYLYHLHLNTSFHQDPLFDLIGLGLIVIGELLCSDQEVYFKYII